MKKKRVKKLQLSRETLQTLTTSEAQKVEGGVVLSCPTRCGPDTVPEDDCPTA
jgi:hypothetical protein